MNRKTTMVIMSLILIFIPPLTIGDALAERTFTIRVGKDAKCEKLSIPEKPPSGGYNVERVWIQREGIVKHYYDEERGVICFEPQRVGSTRVRVSGTIYDSRSNDQFRLEKRFYRSFKVRVRSAKNN